MITSRSMFDDYCTSEGFDRSPLKTLDPADLAFFRQSLDFDEAGGLSRIYFGDLDQKCGCSEAELAQVAALFGIDEKRFQRTYHHFGDGQGNCLRRDFWWCPY